MERLASLVQSQASIPTLETRKVIPQADNSLGGNTPNSNYIMEVGLLLMLLLLLLLPLLMRNPPLQAPSDPSLKPPLETLNALV